MFIVFCENEWAKCAKTSLIRNNKEVEKSFWTLLELIMGISMPLVSYIFYSWPRFVKIETDYRVSPNKSRVALQKK